MRPLFVSLFVLPLLATFAPLSHVTAQACVPRPTGLVSWWPGDGDAEDITGNHGVMLGGGGFAQGMVGQAFSLDGIDGYVQVPDNASLDFAAAITISAWIKPARGGTTIVDKTQSGDSANYRFFLGLAPDASDFRIGFWNGHVSDRRFSNGSVAPNQFSFVSMTLDGGVLKFYINGDLDSTYSGIPPGNTNDGPVRIGRDRFSRFFEGEIDELAIYGRALSLDEIKGIHSAGSAGKCPDASYGTGLAGSGNIIPKIGAGGEIPQVGNSTFKVEVTGAVGGAMCAIAGSLARAETPLSGGTLYGDFLTPGAFLIWAFTTSGTAGAPGVGTATLPIPIPNDPSLIGFTTFWQGFVFDSGSPLPIGVAHTGGLAVTIH